MSPLFNFHAASTLSALLECAALIDSISHSLVWFGFGSSMTFRVISFSTLLGTCFSQMFGSRAKQA